MAQSQAQQGDFFGGGQLAGGGSYAQTQAPARTIEEIQEEERRRIEANRIRGLDANGNPLPAYGTPISQGGTAQGYQVQQDPSASINLTQTATSPGGRVVRNGGAASVQSVQPGDYDPVSGRFVPGLVSGTRGGVGSAGAGGGVVGGQMAAGQGLAEEVLATDPTVAPGNQVTAANRDALTPFVDPDLASTQQTQQALDMSQALVNQITGAPLQSELLADQMLGNQLLVARSARGGAGAVQDATNQALAMAPELQRTASQQMTQEQVARAGAAGQAASIYAGVATNDANRAERIAAANQNAGLQVLNNLTTLTGFDYQFDAAKMNAIGQLARDFFNNAAQFAQMDVQLQIAQWNNMTQRYGIDATLKAAMEKIAADEGIGPLDAFKLVLGAASGAAQMGAAF